MIIETKSGEVILIEQTTYYVYRNSYDREEGNHALCTSSHSEASKFAHELSMKQLIKPKNQ